MTSQISVNHPSPNHPS